MEPVEINAGTYYLRQLRADDRIDDRPALVSAFTDNNLLAATDDRITSLDEAAAYIARRAEQWIADRRYSWAIAEPTTGELVGEIGLRACPRTPCTRRAAEASCWVAPEWRARGVATHALRAALRFGYAALDLRQIDYAHTPDNIASSRLAATCGLVPHGRRDGLVLWRGYP